MRIGIQTWGSHGDTRPFFALADGLERAGHTVTLCVALPFGTSYAESAARFSFRFRQVDCGQGMDEATQALLFRRIIRGTSLTQLRAIMDHAFLPFEQQMYRAALQLGEENDLIIGHYVLYPVQVAAEVCNRPFASVSLSHAMIPTVHAPPSTLPSLGRPGNAMLWHLIRWGLNRGLLPLVNEFRARHGLRGVPDFIDWAVDAQRLNLVAVSNMLCRSQPDWGAQHSICGFLDLPPIAMEEGMPPELEAFLLDGEAPVLMSFGSMTARVPGLQRAALELLTTAAEQAGCRAIIQGDLWDQCGFVSGRRIFYAGKLPHRRVMEHCAAVVHHGGAGTTHSVCAAGLPAVVVAHLDEQRFWGRELRRIGASLVTLDRKSVTSRRLAQAIRSTLEAGSLYERTRTVAAQMRAEHGVERAVQLVEKCFEGTT